MQDKYSFCQFQVMRTLSFPTMLLVNCKEKPHPGKNFLVRLFPIYFGRLSFTSPHFFLTNTISNKNDTRAAIGATDLSPVLGRT